MQRIQDSVLLQLKLLLLFLGEPHLALVQPLHLVDEYLVPLELDVLVSLDRLCDLLGQSVPLLALRTNIRLVIVDRPYDLLLRALLL